MISKESNKFSFCRLKNARAQTIINVQKIPAHFLKLVMPSTIQSIFFSFSSSSSEKEDSASSSFDSSSSSFNSSNSFLIGDWCTEVIEVGVLVLVKYSSLSLYDSSFSTKPEALAKF